MCGGWEGWSATSSPGPRLGLGGRIAQLSCASVSSRQPPSGLPLPTNTWLPRPPGALAACPVCVWSCPPSMLLADLTCFVPPPCKLPTPLSAPARTALTPAPKPLILITMQGFAGELDFDQEMAAMGKAGAGSGGGAGAGAGKPGARRPVRSHGMAPAVLPAAGGNAHGAVHASPCALHEAAAGAVARAPLAWVSASTARRLAAGGALPPLYPARIPPPPPPVPVPYAHALPPTIDARKRCRSAGPGSASAPTTRPTKSARPGTPSSDSAAASA